MQVLYLGINGTLHPSESTYRLLHQRSAWSDGHSRYEAAPWVAEALRPWPDVRIVLTSTQSRVNGLPEVLESLGAELAARVIAHTFEDLTTKLRLGPRQEPLSSDEYWRLNTSDIVRLHVAWLKPTAWIAVNDDTILWTTLEWQQHLVAVDGSKGLLDPTTQDRMRTALQGNFGPGAYA